MAVRGDVRTTSVGAVCDRPFVRTRPFGRATAGRPYEGQRVGMVYGGTWGSWCAPFVRRPHPSTPLPKGEGTGAHASLLTCFKQYSPPITYAHQNSSSVTNKLSATPAWSLGQGPRLRESTACTRERYSLCVTLFALAPPIRCASKLAQRYPRCPKSFEGGLGGTFPQKSSPQFRSYSIRQADTP